jgi:hypothetical protein
MSIMTTADKFRREMDNLLTDEIERLKESISLGFLDNYEQYRHITGKIAGLRAAIDLMKEAEKICNEG